jgi:hypothetical protein
MGEGDQGGGHTSRRAIVGAARKVGSRLRISKGSGAPAGILTDLRLIYQKNFGRILRKDYGCPALIGLCCQRVNLGSGPDC